MPTSSWVGNFESVKAWWACWLPASDIQGYRGHGKQEDALLPAHIHWGRGEPVHGVLERLRRPQKKWDSTSGISASGTCNLPQPSWGSSLSRSHWGQGRPGWLGLCKKKERESIRFSRGRFFPQYMVLLLGRPITRRRAFSSALNMRLENHQLSF